MNARLLNIIQLVALTFLCWALHKLILKVCYILYPIGLKWGGSAPEEIYNFGVPLNIERMLWYALTFFFLTVLEKKYEYNRILSKMFGWIVLLLLCWTMGVHVGDMVQLSLSGR